MANDLLSECPTALPSSFSDDDVCSICLEPFSSRDPRIVTECMHGYHLQCILEWSQRSKDCPVCCRQLVLKDSASRRELLAAVESEGDAISRHSVCNPVDVVRVAAGSDMHQESSSVTFRPASSSFSSVAKAPSVAAHRGGSVGLSEPSPETPLKLSPSEFLNSECIKSKLFADPARYKELCREVEREMSVSIAGLAKMVERVDLSSKHVPLSSYAVGTSNCRQKRKSKRGSVIPQFQENNKRISGITPLFSKISQSRH